MPFVGLWVIVSCHGVGFMAIIVFLFICLFEVEFPTSPFHLSHEKGKSLVYAGFLSFCWFSLLAMVGGIAVVFRKISESFVSNPTR